MYGGASISGQENELRRGVDIVVGTPGRLIDLARAPSVPSISSKPPLTPATISPARGAPAAEAPSLLHSPAAAAATVALLPNDRAQIPSDPCLPPNPQMTRGSLVFDSIRHVVLDECDQMLAVGFEEDVEQLMEAMPKKEDGLQCLLFSATMPHWVKKLARQYLVVRCPIRERPVP